ncbi:MULTISPECIES: hypothetical protein, partial [Pseudomonas]|uniref:hypothetical protein n=1 Tax=Pseudomonas TaxID=286 RepID=UPI001AB034F7
PHRSGLPDWISANSTEDLERDGRKGGKVSWRRHRKRTVRPIRTGAKAFELLGLWVVRFHIK